MRTKNPELIKNIIDFINIQFKDKGQAPSLREIAKEFKISTSCVWKYLQEMNNKGLISNKGGFRGIKTKYMETAKDNVKQIAIVGSVACGTPLLAEQNIDGYLSISKSFLGSGQYFILVANGNSMVDAGICDGDYVLIKQQETAEEGQIVVALIDDEATLKRYYLDNKNKKIRLHPENKNMQDMFFDKIEIQGVATKVIKDLI